MIEDDFSASFLIAYIVEEIAKGFDFDVIIIS